MKRRFRALFDSRGAAFFLIVVTLVAFGISRWLDIHFWYAAVISFVALLVVGLTTFLDDD
jgi:hypothetical protein